MSECSLVRMIQLPLPREHRYIYPINGLFVFSFLASVYQSRIEQPQKLLGQLMEKLRKAEIIIDVQKKWRRCWAVRSRIRRRNCDGRGHRVGHDRGHPRSVPGAGSTASFLLPQASSRFFVKERITARSAPCIARSTNTTNRTNTAISCFIRLTRRPN